MALVVAISLIVAAASLFALSQAMANDWLAFASAVEPIPSSKI